LNDSLLPLASNRDRHANLGQGYLGWSAFEHIMNDSRFNNIPLILETPQADDGETWINEINHLYSLIHTKKSGSKYNKSKRSKKR